MTAPNFVIVALDESKYWTLKDPDADQYVERIEGVYLVDLNQYTHLCEITPSYALYLVENRAVYKDGTPDSVIDRIDGEVMGEWDEPVTYTHVREFDALLASLPKDRKHHYGSPYRRGQNGRNVKYDDAVEGVLEYCRCNAVV